MTTRLYARASNGKIKTVKLSLCLSPYRIVRFTGYLQGAKISHVTKVSDPKQGRDEVEQAELEFNSKLNKYRDRGYKTLNELFNLGLLTPVEGFDEATSSEADLEKVLQALPLSNTDANGNVKPMLAKDWGKVKNLKFPYLAQKKFNGVRCMMFWDDETQHVKALSRQGKDYNAATTHLRGELYELLSAEQELILDGELYCHGESLQTISGAMRKQEFIKDRHAHIEYHVYDIASEDPQTERIEKLQWIFDRVFFSKIKKVPTVLIKDKEMAIQAHKVAVEAGYEGLILRDPEKPYEFGARSMLKVKEFMDEEFLITGIREGERGVEDLVFECETAEGKPFAVKPMGSREQKQKYWDDFHNIVGKPLTVKFFEWSEDKVPIHGVGIAVRDYE